MGGEEDLLSWCQIPSLYNQEELTELQGFNCKKVQAALSDFNLVDKSSVSAEQVLAWSSQGSQAKQMCRQSEALLASDARLGACYAIQAWGKGIMQGTSRCNSLSPPYCLDVKVSLPCAAVGVLLCFLLAVFLGSTIASMILRPPKHGHNPKEHRESPRASPLRETAGGRGMARRMGEELRDMWVKGSCLKVLRGAQRMAFSTATLFGSLYDRFDFQADSVRNQYEHFLSLLRSHCASVADRDVQEGVQVDESKLLICALGDLHTELLEGFRIWRTKFAAFEATGMSDREDGPAVLAGTRWEPLPSDLCGDEDAAECSRHFAEIATYLLVWGESGNIRFMPEVVFFLTELALASDTPISDPLYRSNSSPSDGAPGAPFRSGYFLAQVVRPIYNVIFDEWYSEVAVDPKSGKDQKKLRKGFENFLPADVANYDDWNEFFCAPERLVEGLLLEDGTRLFDLPHGQRFAALHRVDWTLSMDPYETKTHREVHSMLAVFGTVHRIVLLHMFLFFLGVFLITPPDAVKLTSGRVPLAGVSMSTVFSFLGLLVPLHAAVWAFARMQTTGRATCRSMISCLCMLQNSARLTLWGLPVLTFALIRYVEYQGGSILQGKVTLSACTVLHMTISAAGLAAHLFFSARNYDQIFPLTPVRWRLRLIRNLFWTCVFAVKFLLGLRVFDAVYQQIDSLGGLQVGRQSFHEILKAWYSTAWVQSFFSWLLLWFTTLFLWVSDTQLWFTVGCTFLGVATVLVQRSCRAATFAFEDAVAQIPERFSKKVLLHAPSETRGEGKMVAQFVASFVHVWDRVVEYMRYEDKIDNQTMGDQSFLPGSGRRAVSYEEVTQPLRTRRAAAPGGVSPRSDAIDTQRIKVPGLFRDKNPLEIACKHYGCVPDEAWPSNPEVQWRLIALSRGLGLPLPKPYRMPYMPGITVLIPHYGESILLKKAELFTGKETAEGEVPLIDWVKSRYEDEFRAFSSRRQAKGVTGAVEWPAAGSQWSEYTEHQWDKICAWASMRMQTLWRTVAGMCLYHPAIQAHFEAQADTSASLAKPDIWNPSDCFQCLVSMQMYCFFDKTQLEHTNRMFQKFPDCLKVAFIDVEDKNDLASLDNIHERQHRRYFSCLIGKESEVKPDGKRVPKYRIELPGFPILGDGKGDNQNHAIPFMRGTFCQCIDANQGAYFEQMMLLPCVLGEFRTKRRGDRRAKRIIGLPEHITSDIGSIGDFAAGSEMAFGTLLQRSYSVLGARMHYGHPDIMNRQFMMQQGGVSKATKTLNLSEDIFAGMDFTLRGDGRQIRHCEYFHLAKGRDLGFNTVLGFFSKLSSGAGEQIITRQMFRLGQLLPLAEALTFYYAHVGYYFTQFFLSWGMPVTVFTWLVVLAADCEDSFKSFVNHCPAEPAAKAMAKTLSTEFSWLMFLFLLASSMPLVAEMMMQRSFKTAMSRLLKQYLTLSFLMFIFQAKIIGFYVSNELRFGGATYVSTGRGLPTVRRPFIGEPEATGWKVKTVGGLYLDYAVHTYYDGMVLLGASILVLLLGGNSKAEASWGLVFAWISIGLTLASWLYAPFVFNPYQFNRAHVVRDARAWVGFFFQDRGKHWKDWFDKCHLKPRQGFRASVLDLSFLLMAFGLIVWFTLVSYKLRLLSAIYSAYRYFDIMQTVVLVPPIALSLGFCTIISIFELVTWCFSDPTTPAADHPDGAVPDLAPPHRRTVDYRVVEMKAVGCEDGIPLAIIAAIVLMLEIFESFAPLVYISWHARWHGTMWAGVILKMILLEVVLFLCEGLMQSSFSCMVRVNRFLGPVHRFVYANRMCRDLMCSSFIFLTMLPFVFLNTLNDLVCPGCSVHQLLIYRDPGHLARTEVDLDMCPAEYSDISSSEAEELMPSPGLPSVMRPMPSYSPQQAPARSPGGPPLGTFLAVPGTGGTAQRLSIPLQTMPIGSALR